MSAFLLLFMTDSSPQQLSQSEVREVLQYVPIFSGKCFLIVFGDLSDQLMAELLLDLISLQRIGVRLVLVYSGDDDGSLLDWAAEVELKLSRSGEVDSILDRGQAA